MHHIETRILLAEVFGQANPVAVTTATNYDRNGNVSTVTDPLNPDADGNGILDGYEDLVTLRLVADESTWDTDETGAATWTNEGVAPVDALQADSNLVPAFASDALGHRAGLVLEKDDQLTVDNIDSGTGLPQVIDFAEGFTLVAAVDPGDLTLLPAGFEWLIWEVSDELRLVYEDGHFALRGEMYSYSSREVDENGNDLNPLVTVANPLVNGPWILTVRYAPDEDGGALRLDVNGFTRIEALGHQFAGGITTINLGATSWDDRLSPAGPTVMVSGGDALAQTLGTVCAMGDAVSAEQQALLEEYLSDYYGWGDRSAPFVRLASPGDNTLYENQIPDVAMQVEILSQDAPIEKVEYIWVDRDQVLGETAEAPYLMVWENVMPGAYRVQARVTDMAGKVGVSPAHVFIVTLDGFGVGTPGWRSGGEGISDPGQVGASPDGNSGSNPNQQADADIDDDGLTNAEEAEQGTDAEKEDSDGDGRFDKDDMVPYDPNITLAKTIVPKYAVIDLGDFIPMEINEIGTILGYKETETQGVITKTYYLWHLGEWEPFRIGNDDPDQDGIFEIKLAEESPVAFGRWRTSSEDDDELDLCDFQSATEPENEGAFSYHPETGYQFLELITGGDITYANVPLRVVNLGDDDYRIEGEGLAGKYISDLMAMAPGETCAPITSKLVGDLSWNSSGSGSGTWYTEEEDQNEWLESSDWELGFAWQYNWDCECWELVYGGSGTWEEEGCQKNIKTVEEGEAPLTYTTRSVSIWNQTPGNLFFHYEDRSRTYKFHQHLQEGYVGGAQNNRQNLLREVELVKNLQLEDGGLLSDIAMGVALDWKRGPIEDKQCDTEIFGAGEITNTKVAIWFGDSGKVAYLYESAEAYSNEAPLSPAWAVMRGLRTAHPEGLWANGELHPWEKLTGGKGFAGFVDGNKMGEMVVEMQQGSGGWEGGKYAIALPIEIVPDDDQPGVTGDLIPSIKGIEGEKHYVGPKKNEEIEDHHVVLKAKGYEEVRFLQLFEWEGGEEHPTDPMKYLVKRDDPDKYVVKLKTKNGGQEVDRINVWVVWCDIEVEQEGAIETKVEYQFTNARFKRTDQGVRKFKFIVKPASIADLNSDIPELRGFSATKNTGTTDKHLILTDRLSDFSDSKWDVSRKLDVFINNPSHLSREFLEKGIVGTVFKNQPETEDHRLEFPDTDAAGNDDAHNDDEATNIYKVKATESLGIQIESEIGVMRSMDAPGLPLFNDPLNLIVGTTFSIDLNFAEFARLEILSSDREDKFFDTGERSGRIWYRVSDLEDWFFNIRLIFDGATGTWIDNGSTFGKE